MPGMTWAKGVLGGSELGGGRSLGMDTRLLGFSWLLRTKDTHSSAESIGEELLTFGRMGSNRPLLVSWTGDSGRAAGGAAVTKGRRWISEAV